MSLWGRSQPYSPVRMTTTRRVPHDFENNRTTAVEGPSPTNTGTPTAEVRGACRVVVACLQAEPTKKRPRSPSMEHAGPFKSFSGGPVV